MVLQVTLFLALVVYLTSLAIAFHKIIFELALAPLSKIFWAVLLAVLPIVGMVLFYSVVKSNKEGVTASASSSLSKAAKSFGLAFVMTSIIFLVIWIAGRSS